MVSRDFRSPSRGSDSILTTNRWFLMSNVPSGQVGLSTASITNAGGVADISRWCKPPVPTTKCGEPRQGRRNGIARFPQPQPGLGFNLDDEPVVCTTG